MVSGHPCKTNEPWVAYKYEAGLKGLSTTVMPHVTWHNTGGQPMQYLFGGPVNDAIVPLKAANRLVIVEGQGGSIAAFPPPHRFFTARELEYNLGYNFYRKDSDTTFAFGVRHAEGEEDPTFVGRGPEDVRQNFALHSARPGTWQQMPVFFYISADSAQPAAESALAFTRNDRYKALPGYKVMATHFHTSMVSRMKALGGLDVNLPDLDVMKAAGVNIFGISAQVPFGKEMGFAGGIVALAMSLKAVINGAGRGVIGWISDRYGRRQTLLLVCVVLGLAQVAVYLSGSIGSMPLFLLASMVSGFGGGAIFPLFAALTADYFGENNNASNYGLVYSSKLVSGIVGAGLGKLVIDGWGYGAAFYLAAGTSLLAAGLALFLRQPGRKPGGMRSGLAETELVARPATG